VEVGGRLGVSVVLLTCRQVERLLDAFIDGELSPSQMAEVHAHLLQCPSCQHQVEMIRTVGSVVEKDKSEPVLDSGFAMRVLAAMPKETPVPATHIETRRARRQRFWRIAAGSSLPVAAAALFFSVLIWPTSENDVRPTMVRGVVVEEEAVKEVVDPALEVLDDARQSAQSLNQVWAISADGVRRDIERSLDVTDKPESKTERELSFMDIFLNPFDELLQPVESDTAEPPDDSGIVRF